VPSIWTETMDLKHLLSHARIGDEREHGEHSTTGVIPGSGTGATEQQGSGACRGPRVGGWWIDGVQGLAGRFEPRQFNLPAHPARPRHEGPP
jgi:hypothetical protein